MRWTVGRCPKISYFLDNYRIVSILSIFGPAIVYEYIALIEEQRTIEGEGNHVS